VNTSGRRAAASSTSARSSGKLACECDGLQRATKAAVDSVTRTLSAELGPKKVRVNAVNPGMVVTEGNASAADAENEFRKVVEAHTPLGRIGQVNDIAPAVVFFASDDAKWVTGETLSSRRIPLSEPL